ncbi:RidA family protein [Mesorhizobium sp. B2-4-8]|uniref:RidA family protein n=1 Tax=Mesorhizobium sp. B2-4-8 TaxID=2589941 RepID=UPI00112D9F34|nr:RidA family protein [Mesorhizobium sp. B2-4-8]TPL35537.1 RidA family protein [Mesorhizobium sp. B2-4-8]
MQLTLRNPKDGIYQATDDYVHALEVVGAQRLLFISGTMGLDASGSAPNDLEEQLQLIWSNLRRILAEAGMTTDNIVRLTSYLRESSFAEANQNARIAALGERRIPTTAIVVQTLSPTWLVEIEAIAAG